MGDAERLRADLLRYLKVRERTRRELAEYLRRRGHEAEAIAREVESAVASGWVNDRRFAEIFLRDRRRLKPMGRRAVLRDLEQRGVAPEVAREALEQLDPPWDEHALALQAVAGRWERWPQEVRRRKAAAFLQRRGFAGGLVYRVLKELESDVP